MTPERMAKINGVLDKRQNDISVLLENVNDPHNIAAVMRTCDAIGISEIYVLNTQIKPHKKYGRKSSSSAKKWIQVHSFIDNQSCFESIRKKYKKIYATYLNEKAKSIYNLNLSQSCVLVFGNEKDGVSDELRNLCDGEIYIPQVGMIQSLNISVACAVCLYEAFRQKNSLGHYDKRKLNTDEIRHLCEYWDENLTD